MEPSQEIFEIEEWLEELQDSSLQRNDNAEPDLEIHTIGWGAAGDEVEPTLPLFETLDDTSLAVDIDEDDFTWLNAPVKQLRTQPNLNKPISKCTPTFLIGEAIADLQFFEWERVEKLLRETNMNLFGCMPQHEDQYARFQWFSQRPGEIKALLTRMRTSPPHIHLTANPSNMLFPNPSLLATNCKQYFEEVTRLFESVAAVREMEYMKLLAVYCKLMAQRMLNIASTPPRGLHVRSPSEAQIDEKFASMLKDKYYRGIEMIMIIFRVHMLLNLAREISRELWRQQRDVIELTNGMCYRWTDSTQVHSLFQPIIFSAGPLFVGDEPLNISTLQTINHVRFSLGLPLLRYTMLELSPKSLCPVFNRMLPTAFDYIQLTNRELLIAWRNAHPDTPELTDHNYARYPNEPNYGSSKKFLWSDDVTDLSTQNDGTIHKTREPTVCTDSSSLLTRRKKTAEERRKTRPRDLTPIPIVPKTDDAKPPTTPFVTLSIATPKIDETPRVSIMGPTLEDMKFLGSFNQ
ncbi:transactivating tegument protein VP16 [Psittacid alphaherpesvirus 5]|uniref:Alpha trans-inducing protein n=1 Tax=Psittacid alphaherpesvirus 5 TaxID=2972693 RepID=A0A5P9JP32_9ALPH|nr:transactivating tegument protein VP16 [Psittacid alphaherpesvirus 5]QFU14557.1 transactivating tegument protein VP16 [Psittacid alphaherpesvirus 5]UOO01028.1 transactivating tegument protein VP16 [Psittacid alphaherpesvirus 5]